MMVIDLRPFLAHSPRGAALAENLPGFQMSDVVAPLSDEERAEVQATLRHVAALVADTPGAAGSMRRRLGIVVDCLIAVADAIDGDVDLEDGHDAEIVC